MQVQDFRQAVRHQQTCELGAQSGSASESQSGYVFNLNVYRGRSEPKGDISLTRMVVDDILSNYKHHYKAYFDKCYPSPDLFHPLINCGVHCVRTCQTDYHNQPKILKDKKLIGALNKETFWYVCDSPLLYAQWEYF